MRSKDELEWRSGCVKESAEILLKYLEKLGYISEGKKTYQRALTDLLPIAYYALSGHYEEAEVISRLGAELDIETSRIDATDRGNLLKLLEWEPFDRVAPLCWRDYRMLPLSREDAEIRVAVANPLDSDSLQALEFSLGCKVKPVLVSEEQITTVLDMKLSMADRDAIDFIVKDMKRPLKLQNASAPGTYESSTIQDDTSAAPVVRLVNKIFSQSIHCGASDLHIMPQKDHLAVKVRVDGIMRPLFEIPTELKDPVISRIKLLCGMDLAEKRLPQDGRLRFKTALGVKDTRISTVPSTYGENLVARILTSSLAGKSFENLGMNAETKARFEHTLKQSSRVHLVTGPTGSGKTSTLYTSLLHLMDGEKNIITLEDPIEYRIDGITQIQINSKLQLNFAQGLRSILRQDPDVVLVGEIRDEETASISMKVAQTGHVVLSTLHTNSAAAAITRLRDLGVPSYLIASSLGSITAQRLVRKLCPDCSKESCDSRIEGTVKEPVGCEKCGYTGYRGRLGVFSLLEITEEVRDAIRDELGEQEIAVRAKRNGFRTLMELAKEHIASGQTSVAEVERVLGPLQVDEETEDSHTPRQEMKEGTSVTKPKVLYVDDDEDTREIFSLFLEKEHFDVRKASGGGEALDRIYEEIPDLIISDVMMPKMNGLQLLQRLKSEKRLRDIPVLMLTANATEEAELRLMSSGADDFVSKTAKPEILFTRARRLIHAQ